MPDTRNSRVRQRNREFETFVAGAAGQLLHFAALLTAEPAHRTPLAEQLLASALARTYAAWDRLRDEDPYDCARRELAERFARRHWRYRRGHGGTLDRLGPQERLILVLRVHEGASEDQVAATLGLPVERVRARCTEALATMRSNPSPAPRRSASTRVPK